MTRTVNMPASMMISWHWPWAWIVGLAVCAVCLIGWKIVQRKRDAAPHQPKGNEALIFNLDQDFNTEYTSHMLHQWEILNRVAVGIMAMAMALAVTLVARPSQVREEDERASSRDIVLCLDVSPSMLAYDHEVLGQYLKLINNFKGERIGLSLFNSTSRSLFPLTDDYELASSQLKSAADILGKVSSQDKIDKMDAHTTQQFSDLIEGTQNRKDMTSLIGDGLVSCAAMLPGFTYGTSRTDKNAPAPRPASIVLATDNASGKSTYTLDAALKLTSQAGISVDGLYSGPQSEKDGKNANDMRQSIEAHGGTYSDDGSDAKAIQNLVQSIEKRKNKTQKRELKALMVDTPGWWTFALAVLLCAWLALTWKLRR